MATGIALLQQLLDELPGEPSFFQGGLGKQVTLATITTTTVTITTPGVLGLGSNIDPNLFLGKWIFLDTNNETRELGTCAYASQTLTIQLLGANATTAASPTTGYILNVDPAILLNLFNDVLKDNTCECLIPLYHGPDDADMQDSDTVDASWTETNATDTLQTTAAEVFSGARSLVVANSSANGYTQSTTMRMGQGRRVYPHFIAKADTGQGEAAVFDDSSNEEAVVNFTQEDWVYGRPGGTGGVSIGAADEGVFWRLRGDGASDSIDWQFAWFVKDGVSRFNLPNWVLERYQVKALSYAEFPETGSEANTWMADSMELTALYEEDGNGDGDYRFIRRVGDANPNAVWVDPKWLSYPLFMTVLCPWTEPYGVAATFSTFDSSTSMQTDLFVSYAKYLIGRRWRGLFGTAEKDGLAEWRAARTQRVTLPPPRRIRTRAMFR